MAMRHPVGQRSKRRNGVAALTIKVALCQCGHAEDILSRSGR